MSTTRTRLTATMPTTATTPATPSATPSPTTAATPQKPRKTITTSQSESRPRITRLGDLQLSSEDLAGLAKQGFVCFEQRANGYGYFKLRFRSAGRQKVRYLGSDPSLADQIKQELIELQAARHEQLKLAQLTTQARETLRQSKAALFDVVASHGRTFHGFAIRRTRVFSGRAQNNSRDAAR